MKNSCFSLIVPVAVMFSLVACSNTRHHQEYEKTTPKESLENVSPQEGLPSSYLPKTPSHSQTAATLRSKEGEPALGHEMEGNRAVTNESKTYLEQTSSRADDLVTAEELIEFYAPKEPKTRQVTRGIGGTATGHIAVRKQFQNIMFDFDSHSIKESSYIQINEIGKALRTIMGNFPNYTFTVEGHTDNTGSESYNRRLSAMRADSVKRYLVKQYGVDESRIKVAGYGEERPLASNDTEYGRRQNRRVEIVRE